MEDAFRFPWIDPDHHKETLSPDSGYYAIKNEATHKSVPVMRPIHSKGLEPIDGHEWELFRASHRGTVGGVEYLWGMFVEGIGAFNVMAAVENTRKLTEAEREEFSGKQYGMYGSHSQKLSYTFSLGEIPS